MSENIPEIINAPRGASIAQENADELPIAKPLDEIYDKFAELNTVLSEPDKYKEEHVHKLTKMMVDKLFEATNFVHPDIKAWEQKVAEIEKTSTETINTKTQEYESKILELTKEKETLESRLKNVNLGKMGKIYNEDQIANEKTNGHLDIWLSLPTSEQSKYFAANKNLIMANQ